MAKTRLVALRDRAFKAQAGLCYWCDEPMNPDARANDPRAVSAEHVVPRSRGGPTNHSNIVAACKDCNHRRGRPPRRRHHKPR
jgi:5-methylcytosine-specific restriction endonuclease McrA